MAKYTMDEKVIVYDRWSFMGVVFSSQGILRMDLIVLVSAGEQSLNLVPFEILLKCPSVLRKCYKNAEGE